MASQNGRKPGKARKDVDLEHLAVELGGKVPPQAVNAEEAVIGAILLDPDCLDDAVGELSPSCFYSPKCRTIFAAVKELYDLHSSVDLITVSEKLQSDGNLEIVGGYAALSELSQKIGAAANVERYIKILKEKDIQRRLIKASYEILHDAFEESTDVSDLMNMAQSRIFDATDDASAVDVETISSSINAVMERLRKIEESGCQFTGVRSGFSTLDDVTGGFQESDLIIIAARPSAGKTAFAMNIARNAAVDYNVPVAIFSLEMPAIQLTTRLMVGETGLDAAKLKGSRKLEKYEWAQIDLKVKSLAKAPIYIDATQALPVSEFRSKAKRLVKQKQVKLIIVDYLQLMQGPAELRGMREQEVAAISRSLKAAAKELNVPIIALSQLSRAAVQRQTSNNRPQLSDLRESGSIEQDADMVMFIHRADYQGLSENPEDKGKATLIIAKHRNGETCDIDLLFRSSEVKFVDAADSLVEQAARSGNFSSAINDAPFPDTQSFYSDDFRAGPPEFD